MCIVHCTVVDYNEVQLKWPSGGRLGHVVINMSACAKTICTLHHLLLIYLAAMHLMLGAPIKMKSQANFEIWGITSIQSYTTHPVMVWVENDFWYPDMLIVNVVKAVELSPVSHWSQVMICREKLSGWQLPCLLLPVLNENNDNPRKKCGNFLPAADYIHGHMLTCNEEQWLFIFTCWWWW